MAYMDNVVMIVLGNILFTPVLLFLGCVYNLVLPAKFEGLILPCLEAIMVLQGMPLGHRWQGYPPSHIGMGCGGS